MQLRARSYHQSGQARRKARQSARRASAPAGSGTIEHRNEAYVLAEMLQLDERPGSHVERLDVASHLLELTAQGRDIQRVVPSAIGIYLQSRLLMHRATPSVNTG